MRFFGGLAILSLLIVVGVVALSGQKQASTILQSRPVQPLIQIPKTTTASSHQAGAPSESSIGKAYDINAAQTINDLLQSARLNYIGGDNPSNKVLLAGMRQDVGGSKLTASASTSLVRGSILFRRLGPTHLALCSHAGGIWHCFAENLLSGQKADAYGNSLKPALSKARRLIP